MQVPLPGLKDLLAVLDRWDVWKKMTAAPARVDELEKRIAALEAQLAALPGQRCEYCGASTLRLKSEEPDPIFGDVGTMRQIWECSSCGKTTTKLRD